MKWRGVLSLFGTRRVGVGRRKRAGDVDVVEGKEEMRKEDKMDRRESKSGEGTRGVRKWKGRREVDEEG